MKKIYIQGDHFADESGNQILFNGINVVCKEAEQAGDVTVNILS